MSDAFAGSTAQGAATEHNWNFMDWTKKDEYEAQIEDKLGSFNVSIPKSAMEKYSLDENWLAYASMLTGTNSLLKQGFDLRANSPQTPHHSRSC